MSKMGDKVLTEKTRVLVTLSNFFLLIFTIISGVVFIVNWKADVEHRISNNEIEIVEVTERLDSLDNLQLDVIEMKTDLKWIRAYMEKD